MAITQKFIFNKYKEAPAYAGPVFSLQPLPGGQPQDFYHLGDEDWNTESDGSGQAVEAWKSSHNNWYYFEMYEQNGSAFIAKPEAGERPRLSDAPSDDSQKLRVTLPGGLKFSFSVCDGCYQDPYDDEDVVDPPTPSPI